MQNILRIVTVVLTCLVVGFLSGQMIENDIPTWYPALIKPVFNPPIWVFTSMWTLLYVVMGVAGGIVWNRIEMDESKVKNAFLVFIAQLGLSALWSYLFFGLHNPMLAFIEIVLLWLLIYETFTQFKNINKTAGMLLVPYLAWVSFSVVLTGGIWWLNR